MQTVNTDSSDESVTTLADWLAAFGQRLGSAALAPNASGVLGVRYETAHGPLDVVAETDEENRVYLHVRLLVMPPTDQLAFCKRLLDLNAYCAATGGATLAIEPEDSFVILCARQAWENLNETMFTEWLTGFIQHAEALRDLLQHDENMPDGAIYA